DESSQYYCEKLFYWLSKFERKLRYFIYLTLVETFGNQWVKETLREEEILRGIKERTKGKSNEKLIEDALEEFNFSDYTRFLFNKHPELDDSILLDEIEILSQN